MTAEPINTEPATEIATDITAERTPHSLRLQKLFRHTLKAGEVNPLLLIVPLYRQEAEA